ncbi:hypothetical protein P171DRAFT_470844 [Karstenula rhodostoma CBS 690.94]|uniref:F-box domain-containing protein n=1 Tax=Karstenula rhodostoma CBS 690.94 TaxID=1392251 RepID=A0A9P4UFU4_9PLEO|nr:hypothetical protein P171DRAFT_470844 [Karstenula rhodostoma CBS 690.94]
MEHLPQELIDKISSHLDANELKQTLTVNQKFQAAAERYSGAFVEYSLTEANFNKFLDTFSNHRFRYLRRVKFATVLPAPEDNDDGQLGSSLCRESQDDLKALDVEFTRQIKLLFALMWKVEDRVRGWSW